MAGRVAFDRGKLVPALAPVELGRLERQGRQQRPAASPPPPLLLGHFDDSAAESLPAQALGKEEGVDAEETERSPPEQPADDLVGLGIAGEDCQRPVITVTGLLQTLTAKPVADYRLGIRPGFIGHDQWRIASPRRHSLVLLPAQFQVVGGR